MGTRRRGARDGQDDPPGPDRRCGRRDRPLPGPLVGAGSAIGSGGRDWGSGFPFGTVSTDDLDIGRIQGAQVRALLPKDGQVLCVTGPSGSSAAVQRLEGLKSALGEQVPMYEAAAGYWTESDGGAAFDRWYGIYRTRALRLDVIAAQSDELAMGVRRGCEAVADSGHGEMLLKAPLLGVDALPLQALTQPKPCSA